MSEPSGEERERLVDLIRSLVTERVCSAQIRVVPMVTGCDVYIRFAGLGDGGISVPWHYAAGDLRYLEGYIGALLSSLIGRIARETYLRE